MIITFSINLHDNEGSVWDRCVLLHFDDNFILRLKNASEIDSIITQLAKVRAEIKENYNQ